MYSNIITASSLQYVCEAVRDGVALVAIEMDRFYKPGSDDSKQSLVTPSELLNVIKRMQIIGEEVL